MVTQQFNRQRMHELDEQLTLEYRTLHEYEIELLKVAGADERIALRMRMREDLLPKLSAHEREYAELLAAGIQPVWVPENEAEQIIRELTQATAQAQARKLPDAPAQMLELLAEIKGKLGEPGKSAAAKLKVIIPIIPFLVQYELGLDTENFLTSSWRGIRQVIRGWISRDPR